MRKPAGLVCFLLFLTSIGVSQDKRFDVSLGYTAVFSKDSSGNGITDSPTQAGGVLATFRFNFDSRSSLQFNYDHARNSQLYSVAPNTFRVTDTVSEISGAYVFSFMRKEKLAPFLFGGAGVLIFSPHTTSVQDVEINLGTVKQKPFAALYGGGADYKITERFALRVQYRGLFYKAPDFKVQTFFTGARGHLAEPSVGLVFRF